MCSILEFINTNAFFVPIFSILVVSLNPSHQCSQLSRQQFPSPKFIYCHFSPSRVWNYYSGDSSANWLVPATVRFLLSVACALDARSYSHVRMPLTYYSHCITAQPTMPIWLEDNHAKLLTYLLYNHVGFYRVDFCVSVLHCREFNVYVKTVRTAGCL